MLCCCYFLSCFWDRFSSENIFHNIVLSEKRKEKATTKWSLKTGEVLLDADGHELT